MALFYKKNEENTGDLRSKIRISLSDDAVDAVAGGNDAEELKGKYKPPIQWVCPACQQTITLYKEQDGPKHITSGCQFNPYDED